MPKAIEIVTCISVFEFVSPEYFLYQLRKMEKNYRQNPPALYQQTAQTAQGAFKNLIEIQLLDR